MAAVPLNLTLEQGTDFQVNFTVRNKDQSPLNLLGYTASSEMRKHYTATKKYDFDVTFVDRSQGRLRLSMKDAVTGTFAEGRYVYDVEISFQDSSSNTIVERILEGQINVSPSVTRT